ncbi:hypothetical protein [Dyadobacter sp. MSC1_007]|jgi:hypothetical protein|uniref:hypothetical protein n=1 Tax=Dyadobacter sp. MSC1_007 TaxID=2909264 RepID=UPI00202E6E17|nr:hypothetical protein [Dyadobacter sp. MSC1_007]
MKNLKSTKTLHVTFADDVKDTPFHYMIGKAVNTKDSINAYLKGEISIRELHAGGIKFVNTL